MFFYGLHVVPNQQYYKHWKKPVIYTLGGILSDWDLLGSLLSHLYSIKKFVMQLLWRYNMMTELLTGRFRSILIIIIITTTMFMVLSSWPKSLREFTQFIWWIQTERWVTANAQTKPINLRCESAETWLLPSTPTIAIVIITQPVSWYSFYRPIEGGRLSRPRRCSKGGSPCPRLHIAVAVTINTTICSSSSIFLSIMS